MERLPELEQTQKTTHSAVTKMSQRGNPPQSESSESEDSSSESSDSDDSSSDSSDSEDSSSESSESESDDPQPSTSTTTKPERPNRNTGSSNIPVKALDGMKEKSESKKTDEKETEGEGTARNQEDGAAAIKKATGRKSKDVSVGKATIVEKEVVVVETEVVEKNQREDNDGQQHASGNHSSDKSSRGRKRAMSLSPSESDSNENTRRRKKTRQEKRAPSNKGELEAKKKMLAEGLRKALEKERLMELNIHSQPASTSPLPQLPQPQPLQSQSPEASVTIKIEETESPSGALVRRREVSLSEFYSQCFDNVRTFFRRRNYGHPDVMARLEKSGFTEYELRSMKGLDQRTLVTRFSLLLSDGCFKSAQLESLSFAVFAASPTDWDVLHPVMELVIPTTPPPP
ncbi:hypothetical protein JR316_0013380 [Psilocybe cubensis]|uniref:Uncharacterized protein n=2 Tax=Psilocybe cubensis TaxID=181762 RepID=A0ACB8GHM7_PSICU|nr:hypothetical protein JR316_0013380 [Psilocybe cubensis]KAH9474912.1 hypothetical protein JR316_0013380 [Psilocybe cubensis]